MMSYPQADNDEIVLKGKQIYEEQLRSILEPEHIGEHLMIDIETGDYEVGVDRIEISHRAHSKHPNGRFFGMRVGYRTGGAWGARFQRSSQT